MKRIHCVILSLFLISSMSLPVLAQQAEPTGIHLDLSSTDQNLTADPNLLPNGATIKTDAGEMSILPGDPVTAAQYAAAIQSSTGEQTLIVGNTGHAVSGTLNLSSLGSYQLSSLIIPTGVSVLAHNETDSLVIQQSLIANGTLAALSNNAAFTINAGSVYVGPQGLITTAIPTALTNFTQTVQSPVDLNIMSASNIVNLGTISASGNLSLVSGGDIVNGAANLAPTALMTGSAVSLNPGSGVLQNFANMTSTIGSISVRPDLTHDLLATMTGGVMSSATSIDIGNVMETAKVMTQINGGSFFGSEINIYAGDGTAKVVAREIGAPINFYAGAAHVFTESGDLRIGEMVLTGDPTIVNSGGDVFLSGNADGGQTLRFAGMDLAILAAGRISADPMLTLIDLSSNSGNGGDLTIIGGFNFSPDSGGQLEDSITTYTMLDPSGFGGGISLFGVNLSTASTSGDGGNVVILAHDTLRGPFLDGQYSVGNFANVDLGSIDTSSSTGNGGNVNVIGQSTINMGQVNTQGALAGGSVLLQGTEPVVPSGTISFQDGTMFGTIPAMSLANSSAHIQAGSITTSGGITGGDVTVGSGGTINLMGITTSSAFTSGNVSLESTGAGFLRSDVIDTSGLAGASGGNAGTITVFAAQTDLRSLIANGGESLSGGTGGTGGAISLSTPTVNGNNVGQIELGGFSFIQANGGNSSNVGGDAGSLTVSAGTFAVRGSAMYSIDATGGSGATPGTDGTVSISTFGTQPVPRNFDMLADNSAANQTEIAMPGGLFTVGQPFSLINGTNGAIRAGAAEATSADAGRIVDTGSSPSYQNGGITINVTSSSATIDVDGTPTVFTSDDGSGNRLSVNPATALALAQVTRGQAQMVQLDSSGRLVGPSTFTFNNFEKPGDFSSFVLDTANGGGVTLNLVGENTNILAFSATQTVFNGNINFIGSGSTLPRIDIGSNQFVLPENASITGSPGGFLDIGSTNPNWIIDGVITADNLTITNFNASSGMSIAMGPNGTLSGNTFISGSPAGAFTLTGGTIYGSIGIGFGFQAPQAIDITTNFDGPTGAGIFNGADTIGAISVHALTGNLTLSQFTQGSAINIVSDAGSINTATGGCCSSALIASGGGVSFQSASTLDVQDTFLADFGGGAVSLNSAGGLSLNGASLVSTGNAISVSTPSTVSIADSEFFSFSGASVSGSQVTINGDTIFVNESGDILVQATTGDLIINAATDMQSGLLQGGTPFPTQPPLSDVISFGNITLEAANSIFLNGAFPDPVAFHPVGNLTLWAKGDDIRMTENVTLEVVAGNLVLVAKDDIVSTGSFNGMSVSSAGSPQSFVGGAIELAAGVSADPNRRAAFFASPPEGFTVVDPTGSLDTAFVFDSGTGEINVELLSPTNLDVSGSFFSVNGGGIFITDLGSPGTITLPNWFFQAIAFAPLAPDEPTLVTPTIETPLVFASEAIATALSAPSIVAPEVPSGTTVVPTDKIQFQAAARQTDDNPTNCVVLDLSLEKKAGSYHVVQSKSEMVRMPGQTAPTMVAKRGAELAAIDGNRLELRKGELVAATTTSPLFVQVRNATAEIPADAVSLITNDENGTLRVAHLSGSKASITLRTQQGQSFTIAPGQEVVVANEDASDEELIPTDGVARVQVDARVVVSGGVSVARNHFNRAEMARANRLLQPNDCLPARFLHRLDAIRDVAEQSTSPFRGVAYTTPAAATTPMSALKSVPFQESTIWTNVDSNLETTGNTIKLSAGEFIYSSEQPCFVSTNNSVIRVSKGAVIYVSADANQTIVRDLSDSAPDAVHVYSAQRKAALFPGQECVIRSGAQKTTEMNDLIGRRRVHTVNASKNTTINLADFSIMSFLHRNQLASQLARAEDKKPLLATLLKTAASLNIIGAKYGPYKTGEE